MVGGAVAQVLLSKPDSFKKDDWVVALPGGRNMPCPTGSPRSTWGKSPENPAWARVVICLPFLTAPRGPV
ncbi:hypothetical protein ACFSUD_18125 [Sulfitobacter aestuarii]|uniref:Uncharacterized protein n=1 Tax=Sulfitobacter aestuarii TaxID=2161676 RepID=A0ABW5U6R9_9RHOB